MVSKLEALGEVVGPFLAMSAFASILFGGVYAIGRVQTKSINDVLNDKVQIYADLNNDGTISKEEKDLFYKKFFDDHDYFSKISFGATLINNKKTWKEIPTDVVIEKAKNYNPR